MPGKPEPLQRPGASAGRLAAVGIAAVVTLLTLAGLLGVGPGAAQAQMTPDDEASGSSAGPGQAAQDPHRDASTDGSSSDDDWLTFDDSPASVSTPGDHVESPAGTALPSATGTGKRIVYDISGQRVWLVNAHGTVTRTYLVSGGKNQALLDPGRYHVYSMSRNATSYNHKETMQYMVRFATGNHAPIGFHDVPARQDSSLVQSRSELGTPLSSGCIRQWITDARALWDFAEVGTLVVVIA